MRVWNERKHLLRGICSTRTDALLCAYEYDFFTTCGVAVLLIVVYDIYATILHARARSGPVGERLNRGVWRAARFIAFKLPRQRRHRFLNPFGPLLLPMLIIVLIIMLVLGFALIYLPRMPAHLRSIRLRRAPEASSKRFTSAALP
jgi:hypothetical protein